jgi:hypothetical protein
MKPWDLFLPDVLPHCPGCPDLAAEDEIRNSAERFLDETYAWQVWIGGMVTQAGVSVYSPVLPTGARIVKLHEATLDGDALEISPMQGGETGTTYKATTDMESITVGPDAPEAGKTIRVLLSLSITSASTSLADVLFNSYRLAIANGAIARLCRTADKPYSNPDKAAAHEGLFMSDVERYKWRKAQSNSSAMKHVRGHFF